jgi:hypothetical protein
LATRFHRQPTHVEVLERLFQWQFGGLQQTLDAMSAPLLALALSQFE